MRLFASLTVLTALHLAYQAQPAPSAGVDPVEAPMGTRVSSELLPYADASCTLLVFFEPGCPFCKTVADAHRLQGGTPLETFWITDDVRRGPSYAARLPGDTEVLLSRALISELKVRAVPAGAWIRDGRLVAAGALSGNETPAELLAPCGDPAPGAADESGSDLSSLLSKSMNPAPSLAPDPGATRG